MGILKDLTGQRFGRLVVIEYAGRNRHRQSLWRCKCDCGNELVTLGCSLIRGVTKSCGCYFKDNAKYSNWKHGICYTNIYDVWRSMKDRCNNPNNSRYKRYGGRGIRVSEEWNDPKAFYEWATKNGYKKGLVIDRINNDGNYEPSNCRFVDVKTNNRNKSSNKVNERIVNEIRDMYFNGNAKQKEIANKYGISSLEVSRIINFVIWN